MAIVRFSQRALATVSCSATAATRSFLSMRQWLGAVSEQVVKGLCYMLKQCFLYIGGQFNIVNQTFSIIEPLQLASAEVWLPRTELCRLCLLCYEPLRTPWLSTALQTQDVVELGLQLALGHGLPGDAVDSALSEYMLMEEPLQSAHLQKVRCSSDRAASKSNLAR